MTSVRFAEVELPGLSALEAEPRLPAAIYDERRANAVRTLTQLGIDSLVVYADREHAANIQYLTGFDPRFEEAVLVLNRDGTAIVAGNESISMVGDLDPQVRAVLCQSLSLPGQKRETQRRLGDALREAGLRRGDRVGVVGWKPIPAEDASEPGLTLAVPQFLLVELERIGIDEPVDATTSLAGLTGLRAVNEADQLALFEHRSTRASHHVWNALEALKPGLTELDLSTHMRLTGLPHAAHVMLASGTDRVNGLYSPTDRVIREGDLLSTAVGLIGGLSSRAGRVLTAEAADAETRSFVAGYWAAIRTWYSQLTLGASTARICEATTSRLAEAGIAPLLNPGHLQHGDEWLDSPFTAGSVATVQSGWSLQADIIPVGHHPGLFANAEDALAIADPDLRAELAERFPEMWRRVTTRRDFMTENLGIDLAEEVLPFSDRQGALPVGLLTPTVVATAVNPTPSI